jgi:hypothetical protein
VAGRWVGVVGVMGCGGDSIVMCVFCCLVDLLSCG